MALYTHNCSLFSCVDDGNALIYEKVPSCAAFECSNKREAGFRMFRFPREQTRRAIWTAKVLRDRWQPTIHSCLCEVCSCLFNI